MLQGHKEPQPTELSPEAVDNLLQCLIYIVMQETEDDARTQNKASLLEMLKTNPQLQTLIFGAPQVQRLTPAEAQELARLGLVNSKPPVFPNEQPPETSDLMTSALVSIKFIAFKTGQSAPFASSVYFTFSFFEFGPVRTEAVVLHAEAALQADKQYFLIVPEQLQLKQLQNQTMDSVFEAALTEKFEVQPHQRATFAQYLQESALQIDVWDSEKQQKLGSGRVPLAKLARGGQPSKVVAIEAELFEQTLNKSVGALQLLLTNEGRQPT